MDRLEQLVRSLELENNRNSEKQIAILQEIGKKLLAEYVIKVGDITIKPLWIEAYYSNANTEFVDASVHGNERQKMHNILYFHHKTNDQRSGVDVCLSYGDYYLSYLLKYTMVDGVFTTQSALSAKISLELRDETGVLFFAPNPTDKIQFTKRIGIATGDYKDAELAIVRDVNQRFMDASGTKKSLPQKIELLKKYIDEIYAEEERATEAQRKAISRSLVGEYWKDLFE